MKNKMVTVGEASKIVLQNVWQGGSETVPIDAAMGRVLAESIVSDRDLPPFNRVTMDGIAMAHEMFAKGHRAFHVEFVQAAGMPAQALSSISNCCEVMTGAMLPRGADTVVRYEDISLDGGGATINDNNIKQGDNVHRQGNDAKAGDELIAVGTNLSVAEIPVLASVGKFSVLVKSLPKVALISTGDELVDINATPLPHQIRKSNMYALTAALAKHKIDAVFFHLQDNEESISTTLNVVLRDFDLIILSGGVSKGKFDLIPAILESKGVEKKFHQISQRPGKPMWFGVRGNQVVFALPGNPVSTFLCYHRYVEPWLRASLGCSQKPTEAILTHDVAFSAPLTYFLQVKVFNHAGQIMATPVAGGGSGDFVNLLSVDGFLELPLGGQLFKKGAAYPLILFR